MVSVSYIPGPVKFRLWGKAGGRCQYEGCNAPLWIDSLTKAEFNTAYIAHIIADRPKGPRGDKKLSKKLSKEISNLMLMCDVHHRLIDKEDVGGHTVERLHAMKEIHERRIEIVSGITEDKQSHILLYGANIGKQSSPLSYAKVSHGMMPERYPATTIPISLGLVNSVFQDDDDEYWTIEKKQLTTLVETQVKHRIALGEVQHLSVFALAPQPLLVLLGSLLTDIPAADVYQLHREPPDWKWQNHEEVFPFDITEPSESSGIPALNLSLSASIDNSRIQNVINTPCSIWKVSIPSPHNDFLKSKNQLQAFRETMRPLIDRIKARHGENAVLHVFPAVPTSIAVDFGRILMPKADLKLIIYDQNKERNGFIPAIEIP